MCQSTIATFIIWIFLALKDFCKHKNAHQQWKVELLFIKNVDFLNFDGFHASN